jgi:hypothetical protein
MCCASFRTHRPDAGDFIWNPRPCIHPLLTQAMALFDGQGHTRDKQPNCWMTARPSDRYPGNHNDTLERQPLPNHSVNCASEVAKRRSSGVPRIAIGMLHGPPIEKVLVPFIRNPKKSLSREHTSKDSIGGSRGRAFVRKAVPLAAIGTVTNLCYRAPSSHLMLLDEGSPLDRLLNR